MNAALEGDEWSAAHSGRSLSPGKNWYPFYRRLGGPQGWVDNLIPTGIRSQHKYNQVYKCRLWLLLS